MASPIVQDIIFKVGSTGAGAATSEMKGLSAGMLAGATAIIAVGVAANELRQHLNTLVSQYSRLDESQKAAVRNMRNTSQGMISMGTAMATSGALLTAGIKDQAGAMEAIAKAAYEQGARLGEGSDEIKSRIESLTKTLVEGRVTGLREYGISLKRTGDLAKDQTAAINALKNATDDITVSYENADDAIGAVSAELERIALLQYDQIIQTEAVSSALSKVKNLMSDYADVIESTGGKLSNLTMVEYGMKFQLAGVTDALHLTTGAYESTREEMNKYIARLQVLYAYESAIAKLQKQTDIYKKQASTNLQKADDIKKYTDQFKAGESFESVKDALENLKSLNIEIDKELLKTYGLLERKPSRGGRRKEKQPETIDDILGIKKPKPIDSGFDTDIYDSGFDQTPNEIAKQKADEHEAALKMDERNKVLADFRLQQTNAELDDYGHKLNLKQDYIDKITSMDIDANEKHQMLQDEAAKVELEQKQLLYNGIGESASQLFRGIAALQQVEGKKAFEIGKVAAIADTTIYGAMGAVKAYQAMTSVPYVGPVLGAAAAAGVLTYTGVQVAKISKQKYNGGGNTSSSSAPKISTGGLSSSDYNTSNSSNSDKVIENTIILDGNILHQSILTVNDNANQQGQRSFGVVGG